VNYRQNRLIFGLRRKCGSISEAGEATLTTAQVKKKKKKKMMKKKKKNNNNNNNNAGVRERMRTGTDGQMYAAS
jgi:hypothetical protein